MTPKLFLAACLVLVSHSILSQDELIDSSIFTVRELQADLNFFRAQLENHHPILYQYNSPERFDQFFDSLYTAIDRPMNKGEFFRLIASSSIFIKCAHSQIMSTPEMNANIMASKYLLPIDIRFYNNRGYVSFNYTKDPDLNPGTEILSINQKPIEEIYQSALRLLPRDGNSMGFPKFWVNRQFYYYYHLLYDMDKDYNITYVKNNLTATHSYHGMSIPQMDSLINLQSENKLLKSDGVELLFIDSIRTAYLHVGSFTESDIKASTGKKSRKTFERCFERIDSSGYENLILDLQGNGGGSPQAARFLCQYFMDRPFVFKTDLRKITKKDAYAYEERSKSTLFSDGNRGEFKPFKNHSFKGNFYLLMDGGTNSAGSEVVSVVRRYNRGTTIGLETGGSGYLMTSRWINWRVLKLPNTKLKYFAPRRTTVMGDIEKDQGRGEIPDYPINPTIEDYIAERDLALLKAIELIQANVK